MNNDYYKILGVPYNASIYDIRKAYREKALKYHPDRGGSHAKMIIINEAWELLSNPTRRRDYDYARNNLKDRSAQEKAEQDINAAKAAAQNYPDKWENFETFLDQVFGKYYRPGILFPGAGKSISGWICIVLGSLFGGFIGSLLHIFLKENQINIPGLGMFFIIIGAFLGAAIHHYLNSDGLFVASTDVEQPQGSMKIIPCPRCKKKLSFYPADEMSEITCPTCRIVFYWSLKEERVILKK